VRHAATQWYLVTWLDQARARSMQTQSRVIAKESVKALRAAGMTAQMARLPHYVYAHRDRRWPA